MNDYKLRRSSLTILCLILIGVSPPVLAWGERGHDLITRVAVHNLAKISANDAALVRPFQLRNHMLSHLSNVPDIVWRAPYMSKQDRQVNDATHYINLELVYPPDVSLAQLERDYASFAELARSKGISPPEKAGTAPWRVVQLHGLMVENLKLAAGAEDRDEKVKLINRALFYGGIMAHFVGDLANPHHTTADYDGRSTGNGGLHAYFESDVIRHLPVSLEQSVSSRASAGLLAKTVLKGVAKEDREATLNDASKLVFALVAESFGQVPRLVKLDDKHSLLERSDEENRRAKRKPVEKVARRYQKFATERLAIGAATLSRLWMLAWEQAGKPDMSDFHSYSYPVRPEFVDPDYLN
ncbi:MAG: hypothetical protein AAF431_15310 [Pseudomonadota bacterium]